MKHLLQLSLILLITLILVFPVEKSIPLDTKIPENNSLILKSSPTMILTDIADPFFSILATPLACFYNKTNRFLKPLLLIRNNTLSPNQLKFTSTFSSNNEVLSLGFTPTNYNSASSIIDSPPSASLYLAETYFKESDAALILPYNQTVNAYKISLLASPLASYKNIPIFLYDTIYKNEEEIRNSLEKLNISKIYVTKGVSPDLFHKDFIVHFLHNTSFIQESILSCIKHRFQSLNYITITNPMDVKHANIISEQQQSRELPLQHTSLYILGKKFQFLGSDTISINLTIPEGIHTFSSLISIKNKTSIFPFEERIPVLLTAELINPLGKTVAYGHSPGYEYNATYIETLITNLTGEYTLTITLFHGYRGGYFSLRGLSNIKCVIKIENNIQTLATPHYPLIPDLSQNAAYLTAAHGGILIANETFSLTDRNYAIIANNHASGPWYDEELHSYNNDKVDTIISSLYQHLSYVKKHGLLTRYLNGSGWLALLGDTNMLPMYYYSSNQTHLVEQGLPSDNPYSLNHQLSPGRVISYTASDASVLIARTLFYEQLCGPALEEDTWHRTFNFIFGEGFGETGGFFHQIPYANEIESYGFDTTVYGDFRNSCQAAERLEQYTKTNFVEYLGHGDWFWFTPSLYGFNSIGQSIGSKTIRDWTISRPNVVLTSACLMGRVDGVPPIMSIALSFLYAGSNAFIGATRETGREAGLTVLENHLIIDDYSLGEALRGEKQVDTQGPTYYVRCLFGDPAFNPYDPLNGFSNQGNPIGK